jgi:hypothetical protein
MSEPQPTRIPHQPIEITRDEFMEAIRERDAEIVVSNRQGFPR